MTRNQWLMVGGGVAVTAIVGWYLYEHAAAQTATVPAPVPPQPATAAPSPDQAISDQTAQDGSAYGEETYDNPYGMAPEEQAAYASSVPAGVIMAARPQISPPVQSRIVGGHGIAYWRAHPALWASFVRSHPQYRGALHGLGYRRRRFAPSGGGGGPSFVPEGNTDFQAASGGGYYDQLVYDPDVD